MSRYSLLTLTAFASAILLVSQGCGNPDSATKSISMPQVEVRTPADSLAFLAYTGAGGPEMWAGEHIPYLRFSFGSGDVETRRRHLWNRMTGDYRLERPINSDTTLVVLFNVNTKEGRAFYNESPVTDSLLARTIDGAHRAFINDTYWLLMPTKLFDEGVQRTYVADSSNAQTGVLRLTFEGVGYTPDDNYWVWIDRESGEIVRWTYMLQGRSSMSTTTWVDYKDFVADGMRSRLSERKVATNGSFALHTGPVEMPTTVDGALFTSP